MEGKWKERWEKYEKHLETLLPSGSGFDTSDAFVVSILSDSRAKVDTKYHVMNEHGYYMGYLCLTWTVTPTWDGSPTVECDDFDSDPWKDCDIENLVEYIGDVVYDTLYQTVPNISSWVLETENL
tara:strand:- start:892 stop:1266 length:375 start_codon:yes stop_codon:yes gene_type:complete